MSSQVSDLPVMSNQDSENLSTEEVISSIDEIMSASDSSGHRIMFYDSYSGLQPSTGDTSGPLPPTVDSVTPETLVLDGSNAPDGKPVSEPAAVTGSLEACKNPTISEALGLVGDSPLLPGPKPNQSIPKLMDLRLDP